MATTQRIAVIGLGRFGQRLARALTSAGADVIAIDREAKLVEAIRDEVALAVRLDATNEEALTAQGIEEADIVVVGIGQDFESSALTVATLSGLGAGHIIARAENEIQARILMRCGADEIAAPERESAERWSHRLTLPNLSKYVELGDGHSMVYLKAPKKFLNKTLIDLNMRNAFGVNLIAIERTVNVQAGADAKPAPRPIVEIPTATTTILRDDILVLVGSNEALSRLPKET